MTLINQVNDFLWTYIMTGLLLVTGIYFTIRTRGVQFRLFGEMFRLLLKSGHSHETPADRELPHTRTISSFQAFVVSLASRVGTGNIAGVAIAIALGGPGAVFWMWVVAFVGSANAFVESTLAQLFKVRGDHSYCGGPAYYILKGLGSRWYAVVFAVLITVTFGFAFNSVQANTISLALDNSFGIDNVVTGAVLTVVSMAVIWGGIQRIAIINEILVPLMAVLYILLALYVVATRITMLPHVMSLIIENAFGLDQAIGGGMGMAVIMGVKRGLFSNEAGEGSTPNAAATASVTHPAIQGLIQTLGVFTDTILVCSATAFIILCSGVFDSGLTGIELTQQALSTEVGAGATLFVAVAIVMFGFTSIVANYYYGETNLRFVSTDRRVCPIYRIVVGGVVMIGSVASLDLVWALADITMALMTLCNITAILMLGRYAFICLDDYCRQRKEGKEPVYTSSTISEIATQTECWDKVQK